ncbi:MAG: glycosyltransferase family 39 protein [Candidatus Latescibacterota bacterium]|nr:glycosyltransferase family 39 protein [Candidatus Latescibacterota bacterium]
MAPDLAPRRDLWLWLTLALGLSVRLIGLDEPLIDHQAWRQTDTAAIARNYYEEGFDLFHPRVDWRGATAGYVETNFPLYPFLVACVYAILGGAPEWVGRLLSALLSTLTAVPLYHLARRIYVEPVWIPRLAALLYLAMPLNVFFGRAFMPEALMLFLSAAALLSFLRWLQQPGPGAFILAVLTAGLCFLVKIPTLYLGFPLVALAWSRWRWQFLRQPVLWVFAALVLAPSVWWYGHAAGLFEQTGLTFGIWNRYGYDKWSHELLLSTDFYLVIGKRLVHRVFTPAGAALVVWGLVVGWPARNRRQAHDPGHLDSPMDRRELNQRSIEWMPWVWLGGVVLYVLVVPEGNHRLHYYQVPFVPVGALFAALPLARLIGGSPGAVSRNTPASRSRRLAGGPLIASLALLAVAAYSAWSASSYYSSDSDVSRYYRICWEAGRLLDQKLPGRALLVVAEHDENTDAPYRSQSPTLLYYCHRKGWQITLDELESDRLDSLAHLGASFFVGAAGFAMRDSSFWQDLLARGVTFPSAYPKLWTDDAGFRLAAASHRGVDRHILLVDMRQGPRRRPSASGHLQPEPAVPR